MIRKNELWVGRYQEDAVYYGFKASICIQGAQSNSCYVYNGSERNIIEFISTKINELFNQYSAFYFYDPSLIYYLPHHIRNKCVFPNEKELYRWLNNKSIARTWSQHVVKTVPFVILSSEEIETGDPCRFFRGYNKVVVQKMVSEGGEGTYLLDDSKKYELKNGLYCVSPYYEKSISINVTAMISKTKHSHFAPSVQIIKRSDNKLCYCGSDFFATQILTQEILERIHRITDTLCSHLSKLGYLGIIGIDYLIYCNEVFFLEFNPRFQGSSFLIDKALNNYGYSLVDINKMCFISDISAQLKDVIQNIDVPYAFVLDGTQRQVLRESVTSLSVDYSETNYYDYFADIYHIMLPDWKKSINTQGRILKKLFERYAKIPVKNVLDCTCGIGIQALSLAYLGYNVTASDISEGELEWADKEARRRQLSIEFIKADCRFLEEKISNQFDAIISIDSAMPHLVTKDNFYKAFMSIYRRLRYGGVFISTYRDYDKLLKQRPQLAYPVRFKETSNNSYTIFRRWKWKNNLIYSRQYVIEENNSSSRLYTADYIQWAVTKDDLIPIVKRCGFSEYYWLSSEESEFSQPVLCVVK